MADQAGEHVHFYDDGRGRRLVRLDGIERTGVVYADVNAGVIVLYDDPFKSTDGDTIDFHSECGTVEVFPAE